MFVRYFKETNFAETIKTLFELMPAIIPVNLNVPPNIIGNKICNYSMALLEQQEYAFHEYVVKPSLVHTYYRNCTELVCFYLPFYFVIRYLIA